MSSLRRWVIPLIGAALFATGCSSDDGGSTGARDTRTIVELSDSLPGDVIALRASERNGMVVEWIDRRAGTINSVDVGGTDGPAADTVTVLATIEVGTDGEQRGLLGHTVIDAVRYAAWTDPDSEHLVVGALTDDEPATVDRVVWDAGGTAGGAVGGHIDATPDGRLLLGIGQLTDWAKDHGSGALLTLDPAGPPDQEPVVLSDGYINPFALEVIGDVVWVADNAVGDDTERTGSIDLTAGSERVDRGDLHVTGGDPRAPSAVVALGDGGAAVCGFLDAELRPWSRDPAGYGDAIGPCLTGAALLADGTIVTATADGLIAIAP